MGGIVVLLASTLQGWAEGMSVLDRDRPEYDPLGIQLGSFTLYPSVEGGIGYDDNVFNVDSGKIDDAFYLLSSQLNLRSDWGLHALNLDFRTNSIFYDSESGEDHTDIRAAVDGRLDVTRGTTIVIEGHYDRRAEERGSPDLPGFADEPTRYSVYGGTVTVNQSFNRLTVSAGGAIDRFDYRDTPLVGGGTFNNDDRDRDVFGAFAKLAFEFSPGYGMFVRGTWNDREYDSMVDDLGFERDSHGQEIVGGVQFEVTRLLVGDIYGGYLWQYYDDPAFEDIKGVSFGAGLEWYTSPLTTVRLDARTTVEETTLPAATGYKAQSVRLGLDHELFPNLIVTASGAYQINDYKSITREDKLWSAGAKARYLLNRNLEIDLAYKYINRSTNAIGQDYVTNVIELRLIGKL